MVFNPESLKSGFSVQQIALLTTEVFKNECNLLFRQPSLASLSIWLMSLKSRDTQHLKSVCVCVCVPLSVPVRRREWHVSENADLEINIKSRNLRL